MSGSITVKFGMLQLATARVSSLTREVTKLEKLDVALTERSIDAQSQIDNYKTSANDQLTAKFNADVATLQEQLQAGTITQEQYNEQYLELQNALSEAKKQLEEQASNVIDFDEISREGQRISQELNKAKTEKEMWEKLQSDYKNSSQQAAQS